MKKLVALICTVAILFAPVVLHADDTAEGAPDATALKKLGRGLANVLTCPYEVVYRIGEANDEDGVIAAFTWGIINGVFRVGYRAVVGVYEVATFPIPFPADYKPIITDPEFFLQDALY